MKSFAVIAAVAGVAVAQNLGGCAQLCADNMARIANTEFSCPAGDVGCFCSKSNWAYGIRDCSAQACGADEASQAVNWAADQCKSAGASGSVPAALPILTGAVASASGSVASATGSLVSETSGAVSSIQSGASSLAASVSSAIESAQSSASDALASATNSIHSAASSAAASATSAAGSAAASATSAAGAAKMTGLPIAGAAGLAAWFLL